MLCDRVEVVDVLQFLILCEEFEWKRHELLRKIGDIDHEGLDILIVGGVDGGRP